MAEGKKMENKKFVIRKQRSDSLQTIDKPRYIATIPLSRAEVQEHHSIQNIDYEVENLPVEFQLSWDKKNQKKWRQNLVRAGIGGGFNSDETLVVGLLDVLFHKKINDLSTHVIFSFKRPDHPGIKENLEIYADYQVTDFCKPYIIFGHAYNHFTKKPLEGAQILIEGASHFNVRIETGCPLVFEKIKFCPSLSYKRAGIGFSMREDSSVKIPDCTENDLTLKFDTSMRITDNQEFSLEASLKNLFYNKDCPITHFAKKNNNDTDEPGPAFILKPLGNQRNVHFLHVQPKYLLTIKDVYLGPKLSIDFCTNKKFVKDSRFSFLIGFEGGWYINDIVDIYLNIDNGMKTFSAEKVFKLNPWVTPQTIRSTIDRLGLTVGGNAKFANFKFNIGFGANYLDLAHNALLLEKLEKNQDKWENSLGYGKNAVRLKENLGGSYENDFVTVLLNGVFCQLHCDSRWNSFIKVKSDIFVKIIDKILLHFNMRHSAALPYSKDPSSFHYWNLGLGADYLFSDMFGFFFSIENILKNKMIKCDGMPDGLMKFIFGVSIVPDRWLEKNPESVVE